MIDYVSAIHQRISRRSYLPAPIEEEKLAVLKRATACSAACAR